MDFNPLDLILHLDVYLDLLVTHYGTWVYAILFLVIFCETGLVVMPFLPGDSLLFIAGAVAAGGGMDPVLLGGLLMFAAIIGDSTNYIIGRTAGERLFSNPKSKIFRRDYLERTHEFYERHGGKTVTLARFLPIIWNIWIKKEPWRLPRPRQWLCFCPAHSTHCAKRKRRRFRLCGMQVPIWRLPPIATPAPHR